MFRAHVRCWNPSLYPILGGTYPQGFNTVHTEAQMGPPILNVAATLAPFTCNGGGTLPSNCHEHHPSIATPVAPMGWPFAISPPEVLMPHSPSTAAFPSTQYCAPFPYSAFPRTSVPSAPMTVKQSWISATFTSAGLTPAIWYALFIAFIAPAGRST